MSKSPKSPPVTDRMVTLFSALADPTRLRLLNLMRGGEVCVCFFVEVLGEGQPKISRHLAYLRRAGVVGARRDGKWIHYRITHPAEEPLRRILDDTLAWMENDPEMQQHRSRLMKVCCAPSSSAGLQGAPMPRIIPQPVAISS
jgi:ArsR family transcriptional regulator, arsenate/arsenite/antimonite-responsive transcriptional repressor